MIGLSSECLQLPARLQHPLIKTIRHLLESLNKFGGEDRRCVDCLGALHNLNEQLLISKSIGNGLVGARISSLHQGALIVKIQRTSDLLSDIIHEEMSEIVSNVGEMLKKVVPECVSVVGKRAGPPWQKEDLILHQRMEIIDTVLDLVSVRLSEWESVVETLRLKRVYSKWKYMEGEPATENEIMAKSSFVTDLKAMIRDLEDIQRVLEWNKGN